MCMNMCDQSKCRKLYSLRRHLYIPTCSCECISVNLFYDTYRIRRALRVFVRCVYCNFKIAIFSLWTRVILVSDIKSL